jgi:hypothetical protein
MSERVVEFGTTRYEWVEDAQGGHWWPDVTPQERALVEELERQQEGMRALLDDRARFGGRLAAAVRALLDEYADDAGVPHPVDLLNRVAEPHRSLLRQLLEGHDR